MGRSLGAEAGKSGITQDGTELFVSNAAPQAHRFTNSPGYLSHDHRSRLIMKKKKNIYIYLLSQIPQFSGPKFREKTYSLYCFGLKI